MTIIALVSRYLLWHYTQGLSDLAGLSRTLLWFIAHTFSLRTLLMTFFVPWKQEGEGYPSIVEPVIFFEALIVNVLMIIVGMVARSVLIIVCLFLILVSILFIILVWILWLLLPILVPMLALVGSILLFS
jgi:hypothetical protein